MPDLVKAIANAAGRLASGSPKPLTKSIIGQPSVLKPPLQLNPSLFPEPVPPKQYMVLPDSPVVQDSRQFQVISRVADCAIDSLEAKELLERLDGKAPEIKGVIIDAVIELNFLLKKGQHEPLEIVNGLTTALAQEMGTTRPRFTFDINTGYLRFQSGHLPDQKVSEINACALIAEVAWCYGETASEPPPG